MLGRLRETWARFRAEVEKRAIPFLALFVVTLLFEARLTELADWVVAKMTAAGLAADAIRGLIGPLGLVSLVLLVLFIHAYWTTRPSRQAPRAGGRQGGMSGASPTADDEGAVLTAHRQAMVERIDALIPEGTFLLDRTRAGKDYRSHATAWMDRVKIFLGQYAPLTISGLDQPSALLPFANPTNQPAWVFEFATMLDRRLELLRELANRRWVGGATIFLQAQPGAKASSQRARTEKHRLTVNLLATNPFEDGKCKCGWTGPRSEWEAHKRRAQ